MSTLPSVALPRATVLVVDDTPENLHLMSGLLKDLYRVKVANSGERALRLVNGESPPDLILLDVMMPGMDGYEVCAQLKENPATAHIPVIFLTAKSAVADEEKGFAEAAGSRHPGRQPRACSPDDGDGRAPAASRAGHRP